MNPIVQHSLPAGIEEAFEEGARRASEFFEGKSDLHQALERLTERLQQLNIPYAIVGDMALHAYGYHRMTEEIETLMRPEGLAAFKKNCLGRGYVEKFPGSKSLRDATCNVPIDVLLTGDYPGDGKEKPVSFPDPAIAAIPGQRYALLPLENLIELKLASGMTAPHRLRDLADVLELIRIRQLDRNFAESLSPWVRKRYLELWQAAQQSDG